MTRLFHASQYLKISISSVYIELDGYYMSESLFDISGNILVLQYNRRGQHQLETMLLALFVNTGISSDIILCCSCCVVTCIEYFVVLVSWFIIMHSCKYLTEDHICDLLNNFDVKIDVRCWYVEILLWKKLRLFKWHDLDYSAVHSTCYWTYKTYEKRRFELPGSICT